ncbi:MAG: glycosyltransferase [Clostridia bacterium]|nr:glycosyltransferase [Clostridia bacterium]
MLYDILMQFKEILSGAGVVIGFLFFYKLWNIYKKLGFFATRQYPPAKKQHKYAIMIAARNEETVIGNLIDSINAQDYPSELIQVFVVADNCTDNTAEVARKYGAVCYERFDNEHRTKGYALEFLVDNISRDYGIESFDAYFIFDADNLLKKDYITRMNEAFDSGEKIVTSYRNTKNFGDNWIAAGYGIHWLRSIRQGHRPRSVLGLATNIQGTGFMFANELIRNGWHYVSFTEDRAFSADAVVAGYRISYCDKAEFYDEQPISIRIAFRQRIRWAKGHLQAFVESGPKLFWHIFVPEKINPIYKETSPECDEYSNIDNTVYDIFEDINKVLDLLLHHKSRSISEAILWPLRLVAIPVFALLSLLGSAVCFVLSTISALICTLKKTHFIKSVKKNRIFQNVKMRYMSYDMLLITFPNNVANLFRRWLNVFANIALYFVGVSWFSNFMSPVWAYITMSLGPRYIKQIFQGIYVFFVERKRIIKIPLYKKVFYSIMWPIFDIIGSVSVLIALFTHVEWKPIPHNSNVSIDNISKELAGKK